MPLVRALFLIFFIYPLMRRIDRRILQAGLRYRWSPLLLVLIYFIGVLTLLLIDQGAFQHNVAASTVLLLTSYGVFITVIVCIQHAINFSEGDEQGLVNANLTLVNWVWMLFGLLFWPAQVLLAILSLVMG